MICRTFTQTLYQHHLYTQHSFWISLISSSQMDMLVGYPYLIPLNTVATEYEGFIRICDEEFHVHIELPITKKLTDMTFSCEWKLQQYLKGYDGILKQRLVHCSSLSEYLSELKDLVHVLLHMDRGVKLVGKGLRPRSSLGRILTVSWTFVCGDMFKLGLLLCAMLERKIEDKKKSQRSSSRRACGKLIAEIEEIGWDRLVSVDADFLNLELKHVDSKSRRHVLRIKVHPEHPRHSPQCIVDLPEMLDFQWSPTSSLASLYTQFTNRVDNYQQLFDVMEELDQNTWVLEPEKPLYSALYRRLAVGTNASLQLTVGPAHPCMLPECQFFGSDQVVNPLKQNLNANHHLWDPDKGLLHNLQSLLGITFPSPKTSKKEEYSVECGICYAYRLETEIPDEACTDQRCGQPFHQTCLYEWLRTLPSSRQSFNTLFGECPYCSKPITVKMPVK